MHKFKGLAEIHLKTLPLVYYDFHMWIVVQQML